MNLFEYKEPLVIIFPNFIPENKEPDMKRNIAELFEIEGGLVFFDVWWYEASFHAIHEVKGEIKFVAGEQKAHWEINTKDHGKLFIKKLEKNMGGDKPFQMWNERELWEEYKQSKEGEKATRELAEKLMKKEFD